MAKVKLFSISILIASCVLSGCKGENFLSQYGSANQSCSLQIDSSSWLIASSPNQAVFPTTNFYASVQAQTLNCGSILSGSNDIKISINFNSSVSSFIGQQLALVSFSVGAKTLVSSDTALNFTAGNLKGTIMDSRTNSNWKAPFADPGFMTFTFQIPNSIVGQMNFYPSGTIYFDQVN